MTELLNQQAIDGLFDARSKPGNIGLAGPLHAYNFRQPFRLGPAAQRSLENVQTSLMQALRRMLAIQLRMPVEVSLTATETVEMAEFALSLGTPSATYLFPVGRGDSLVGVLDWGLSNAYAFVDRMLGGPGLPVSWTRPLTPIEEGIIRLLTERTLPILSTSWKDLLPIGTSIRAFDSGLSTSTSSRPEDRVLATLIRIRTENLDGTITIGLPWVALEPMLGDRTSGRPLAGGKASAPRQAARRLVGSDLRHSHLTVTARMPAALFDVRQLRRLEVGQILDTGHGTDTPVRLLVNDRFLFQGSLGQARGHVVVRLTEQASGPAPGRMLFNRKGRVV